MSKFVLNSIKSNRRMLDIAFGAISIVFILWTITIWAAFPELPAIDESSRKKLGEYKTAQVPPLSAFNVMVESNLFSPYRGYGGLTIAKAVKVETSPKKIEPVQQKTPPPKLTLIGTILVGNSKKAVLSSENFGKRNASYKMGDDIEGFVIKKIDSDKVLLEREDEILEITMKGSSFLKSVQRPSLITPALPGTNQASQESTVGFVQPMTR